MREDVYALHNRVRGMGALDGLGRGEGIREEEEFMWRGK